MYYQDRTVDTTPADAAITRRSPMTPACTLSDQESLRSAKTRRVRASGVELFQGWRFNLPVKRAVGSERSSVSGPSITFAGDRLVGPVTRLGPKTQRGTSCWQTLQHAVDHCVTLGILSCDEQPCPDAVAAR